MHTGAAACTGIPFALLVAERAFVSVPSLGPEEVSILGNQATPAPVRSGPDDAAVCTRGLFFLQESAYTSKTGTVAGTHAVLASIAAQSGHAAERAKVVELCTQDMLRKADPAVSDSV